MTTQNSICTTSYDASRTLRAPHMPFVCIFPAPQVHWFPSGEQLVTASADKSVRCWDAEAGLQIKRLTEHTSIVNSVQPLQRGPALFVSGGDDSRVKVGVVEAALLSDKSESKRAHVGFERGLVLVLSCPFVKSAGQDMAR